MAIESPTPTNPDLRQHGLGTGAAAAQPAAPSPQHQWAARWVRGVTLVIVLNLVLVFFNLTYIPLRQVYLHYGPALVKRYDPVKAIEPHPVTQRYLAEIGKLRSQISQFGLTGESTAVTLTNLRQQSTTLIAENPFLASGQVIDFARLKRRIRQFTGTPSAELGLKQLWQPAALEQGGWPQVDHFLHQEIEPLLRRNYFRETLPTGQFVDEFWRIDLVFIAFFGCEWLIRTLILSRQRNDLSWGAALARRWYELPLLLPFWRWLRLLPAGVRLHRTGLCDGENLLMGQITHEPAAYLSDRVSKFAMVRLVNQTQAAVQEGTWQVPWQSRNGVPQGQDDLEKLDQIVDRLLQLVVFRVMPGIKPDLELLLRHSLAQALLESDLYDGLQNFPGLDSLPREALNTIADYLAQASCDALVNSYTDQEGRVLLNQLSRDFRHSLGQELQSPSQSRELRMLLSDLLESLKVNYIQRAEQDDPETTLQEVNALDQKTQGKEV